MRQANEKAFNAAVQMVIAKLSNTNTLPDEIRGVEVGKYFKEIYEAVSEVASSIKVE